jgi:hypothetical protein
LRQAREEELRVVECDEGSLEACAAEESHGSCFESFRIFARDQDEERGRLVEPDVRGVGCCHARRQQVAASQTVDGRFRPLVLARPGWDEYRA